MTEVLFLLFIIFHSVFRFLNAETLPGLMQNIGLALLTIFIPLVIFLLDKKENTFDWDRVVILDRVIRAKNLFVAVCFIFLPVFFWNFKFLRILLFIIFVAAVIYIVRILINSYKWLRTLESQNQYDPKNFRNVLRNEYLDSQKDWSEKEKIWGQTWRKTIDSNLEELNLVRKFISNINYLIANDSFDVVARYLQTFFEFIDKRSLYNWVIFGDFFNELLNWRFTLYQKNEEQKADGSNRELSLFESEAIIVRLIDRFVQSTLQKGTAYLFFKGLEAHIKNKDEKYIKMLFSQSICRNFFDNVAESGEHYDIWENNFPAEWKITKITLENKNNVISKIRLENFLQWTLERFRRSEDQKEFDKSLDNVSSELFPSVEPHLWATILTFLMRPWTDNNRMKSLVEHGTNFGYVSRMKVRDFHSVEDSVNQLHKDIAEQEEATIELVLLLFKGDFVEERLQTFISELQAIEGKYGEKTNEEIRRKNLISIFGRMSSAIKKRK